MNQLRFHVYTFIGSWPWCYVLAYVGMKLGDSWDTDPRFKAIFHRFHLAVELVLVAGIIWFVYLPLEEPHPHRRSVIALQITLSLKPA